MSRILDLLEAINEKLGMRVESATSSVEIRTSTRGVDVGVKVYCARPDVPVSEAGSAAMQEFLRVNQELTARLSGST
jgi:hypothetical protein